MSSYVVFEAWKIRGKKGELMMENGLYQILQGISKQNLHRGRMFLCILCWFALDILILTNT
jgi:hypothetical protein